MESARKCLDCGLPLPGAADGNHCPNCLFRLAFATQSDGAEELAESTARPASHPHYFAGYELVSEIAFGGMGVVWKARQLGVNRLVALKMIPAGHLASPQMRLRFRVEIETVAQLDHPHIVPLYETGEHEGQHYFSMKLLEGGNLGEWIGRHRSDARPGDAERQHRREAVRLLITIARAVHHAHQRGVLHRDLKPSNILLDQQGEPHVADFGLAKVLGRDSGLTFTESALGSPNYMAPEQAVGHSTQLSVAADVYGLGAILYELLTDQPPFQAATAVETMRRVVDEEVVSPRQLNPGIDADLGTICLKCLQKLPASRYDSAEALAADLERWLAGQPIHARPVGPMAQFARWCRRQPALATALGLSLLLLVVVVVGTAVAAVRVSRAERIATAHLRESLLGQARVLRLNSSIGLRDEGLQLIRQAMALGGVPEYRQELRNEMVALLARTEVSFVPQPQLRGASEAAWNVLSPQGDRFASVTDLRTVLIQQTTNGQELTQIQISGSPILALEGFSPDGRFLAVRQAGGFSIWDAETGTRCFSTNRPGQVFCFARGGTVILQTKRKVATLYQLPAMEVQREVSPYEENEPRASWSALALAPDGRRLAAVRRGSRAVELIDLETSRVAVLTNEGRAITVSWNPESNRLAVGTTARRLAVWNTDSRLQIYLSNVLPGMPQRVALDAPGFLYVAACDDGMVRFFDGLSTAPVFELAGEVGAEFSFDTAGTRLQPILRHAVAGFVQLQRPRAYFESVVADTSAGPSRCFFAADGELVAVGTATNVTFCNAADGMVRQHLGWNIGAACADPREPAVLAAGSRGLFRWPLFPHDSEILTPATGQRLARGSGWRSFSYSAEGDWFVGLNIYSNAAFVFDRTLTNRPLAAFPHPGLDFAVISPGGRWVATGSEVDRQIKIWNPRTQREVVSFPGELRPRGEFSPDGKWFAVFGADFELRAVDTWKRVPLFREHERAPVPGTAAFSPDGRILAVVTDVRAIHLIDLPSRQTLAILRLPGATEVQSLAFSPDGTQLAAVGDAVRLRVWDLPALRKELAAQGLDWSSPP